MLSDTAASYRCLDWIKSNEFIDPIKNWSDASSNAFSKDLSVLLDASYNLIAPIKSKYAWLIVFSRLSFSWSYWYFNLSKLTFVLSILFLIALPWKIGILSPKP